MPGKAAFIHIWDKCTAKRSLNFWWHARSVDEGSLGYAAQRKEECGLWTSEVCKYWGSARDNWKSWCDTKRGQSMGSQGGRLQTYPSKTGKRTTMINLALIAREWWKVSVFFRQQKTFTEVTLFGTINRDRWKDTSTCRQVKWRHREYSHYLKMRILRGRWSEDIRTKEPNKKQ